MTDQELREACANVVREYNDQSFLPGVTGTVANNVLLLHGPETGLIYLLGVLDTTYHYAPHDAPIIKLVRERIKQLSRNHRGSDDRLSQ